MPHLLYPFIRRWTFGLSPYFGYCWSCCYKHRGSCTLLERAHLCPLDRYVVVQLLGHKIVLLLICWGTSILFSRVAALACIPTNNAKEIPFLRILANICCCLSCSREPFWQVWGGIPLWCWFVFPWWWVVWSIFSRVGWPSVIQMSWIKQSVFCCFEVPPLPCSGFLLYLGLFLDLVFIPLICSYTLSHWGFMLCSSIWSKE